MEFITTQARKNTFWERKVLYHGGLSFCLLLLTLFLSFVSCTVWKENDDSEEYVMPREKDVMTPEEIKSFEEQFSSTIRQQANTAANFELIDNLEKEVYYYLNLARLNPQLFAQTFVANYHHKPGNAAGNAFAERKQSLMKYLSSMEPLEAIVPNDTLWNFAVDFAITSGELGLVGHDRSKTDCISPEHGFFSECCSYGRVDNGLWYVLDLLVDEQNASLENRRIILDIDVKNPKDRKKYMGVDVFYHSTYDRVVVLDFWSQKQKDHYCLGDALSGYDIETLEEQFSSTIRQQANTAANVDYLTPLEKELFYYLNLARLNPQLFANSFVANYNHDPGYQIGYAFAERKQSLLEYLSTMKPLPALIPDETLFEFAECFATEKGRLGLYGHDRSQTGCINPNQGMFAECCSYGHRDSGLWVIMGLLVDTGESNAALGHRRIMLNIGETSPTAIYKYMGVAIRPHTVYGQNMVLDFWSDDFKAIYEQRSQ